MRFLCRGFWTAAVLLIGLVACLMVVRIEYQRYWNSCTALEETRACVEQVEADQADVFEQVEALKTQLNTWDFECICTKLLLAEGWKVAHVIHKDAEGVVYRVDLTVTRGDNDEQ